MDERRKAKHELQCSRRVKRPRVTQYTWEYISKDVSGRGLSLAVDAEENWHGQVQYSPSKRNIRLMDGWKPSYTTILLGKFALEQTNKQRLQKHKKQSHTLTSRDLGQRHWMESVSIRNIKHMFGQNLEFLCVPDGRGSDLMVRPRDSETYLCIPVQVKSAEWRAEGDITLSVKRSHGEHGGNYENMVIIGVILEEKTREQREEMMNSLKTWDFVPEWEALEYFVYSSACCFPSNGLSVSERRNVDDKY